MEVVGGSPAGPLVGPSVSQDLHVAVLGADALALPEGRLVLGERPREHTLLRRHAQRLKVNHIITEARG